MHRKQNNRVWSILEAERNKTRVNMKKPTAGSTTLSVTLRGASSRRQKNITLPT